MHAIAVVANQWFWHKRRCLAIGVCNVQDAVLVDLHFVCFLGQCIERHANLTLASGAYFVMVQIDLKSHRFHC